MTLYHHDWRKGHQVMGRKTTPKTGWVKFPGTNRGGSHFLFAQKGDQVALDPSYLYLYKQSQPREQWATPTAATGPPPGAASLRETTFR